jgi:hypothetical protein
MKTGAASLTLVPGRLSLQVGLRPSVPCLAQLSSPQLNSGTASNCLLESTRQRIPQA